MKTFILSAISFILTVIPMLGNAQEKTGFQQFLEETFEVKLSNLDQGNNNAPFLKAFDEQLVSLNAVVSVNGSVTQITRTKEELKSALARLGRENGLTYSWDILQYNELTARESTMFASFKVKVTLEKGGKTISKGKNIVQIIAKKMDGFFVITYMSVIQISDKMYAGPCYVNITKNSDNSYATTISYPNGTEYEFVDKSITFTEADGMTVVQIENIEQKYFWNPKLNSVSLEMRGGRKVGTATEPNGIILVVLKDIGSKKCTKMVLTSN